MVPFSASRICRSGRPGSWTCGILVARCRPLDSEEDIAVPVGARDLLGDGGERLVSPAVPFEAVTEGGHGVSPVFPLTEHLRTGPDRFGDTGNVKTALPHPGGDGLKSLSGRGRQ